MNISLKCISKGMSVTIACCSSSFLCFSPIVLSFIWYLAQLVNVSLLSRTFCGKWGSRYFLKIFIVKSIMPSYALSCNLWVLLWFMHLSLKIFLHSRVAAVTWIFLLFIFVFKVQCVLFLTAKYSIWIMNCWRNFFVYSL